MFPGLENIRLRLLKNMNIQDLRRNMPSNLHLLSLRQGKNGRHCPSELGESTPPFLSYVGTSIESGTGCDCFVGTRHRCLTMDLLKKTMTTSLCETFHQVVILHATYHYLILGFAQPLSLITTLVWWV